MKGTSTITSSTSVATKIHGAHFSHSAIGICTTASAATNAITSDSACRDRKCVGV